MAVTIPLGLSSFRAMTFDADEFRIRSISTSMSGYGGRQTRLPSGQQGCALLSGGAWPTGTDASKAATQNIASEIEDSTLKVCQFGMR